MTAKVNRRVWRVALGIICVWAAALPAETVDLVVLRKPLHDGRISPMLYGGFVELLDDVVPGMWAEMLGDRNFEGVVPTANWVYHLGALNLCDRDWDKNETWAYSTEDPWNGAQSAKLTAAKDRPARLTQSQLAVAKGMAYRFSGYFRGGSAPLDLAVRIKTLLPDGQWMILAGATLPKVGADLDENQHRLELRGHDRPGGDRARSRRRGQPLDRQALADAGRQHRRLAPGRGRGREGAAAAHSPLGRLDHRSRRIQMEGGRRRPGPAHALPQRQLGPAGLGRCRRGGVHPVLPGRGQRAARLRQLRRRPSDAGELVEYCNGAADTPWGKRRADNGRPEPYGVKYWQLGNEVGDAHVTATSADFCRAIRNADPQAVIFSSFPSGELLEKIGGFVSYLCPHYYSSDLAWVESDIRGHQNLIRNCPWPRLGQAGGNRVEHRRGQLGPRPRQTVHARLRPVRSSIPQPASSPLRHRGGRLPLQSGQQFLRRHDPDQRRRAVSNPGLLRHEVVPRPRQAGAVDDLTGAAGTGCHGLRLRGPPDRDGLRRQYPQRPGRAATRFGRAWSRDGRRRRRVCRRHSGPPSA